MRSNKLAQAFADLHVPQQHDELSGSRQGDTAYHVARDRNGDPVVLIEIPLGMALAGASAIRLRHFQYEPGVRALVRDRGGESTIDSHFLVVRCTRADHEMVSHFFDLMEGLVAYLGPRPFPEAADGAIREVVEIFRSMAGPSRTGVVGLWGELLLIAGAHDVRVAAAAWRSDPNEIHDFTLGSYHVEVKTTTRPVREHEIALGQLVDGRGDRVTFASLMVEPNDAGTSIADLLGAIVARLPANSEAPLRVRAITARTLGESWRDAAQVRFDLEKARASLRWFSAEQIPSPSPDLPPQVSRVRFTVDLSDCDSLPNTLVGTQGPLAVALAPAPNTM